MDLHYYQYIWFLDYCIAAHESAEYGGIVRSVYMFHFVDGILDILVSWNVHVELY